MIRRPPRCTRTDTRVRYPTLFRSPLASSLRRAPGAPHLGLARDRRRRNQPPRSRYLANREDDARANLSRRGLGRFTSDVRSEVAVVISADDKIEIRAPRPPALTDRQQRLSAEGDERGQPAGPMRRKHPGTSSPEV